MGGGKAEAREKCDFSFDWKRHRAAERGRREGRRPHPVVAGTEKGLTESHMALHSPRKAEPEWANGHGSSEVSKVGGWF